ncbi:hypothetical protein D3C81_07160 [compost metagenome]
MEQVIDWRKENDTYVSLNFTISTSKTDDGLLYRYIAKKENGTWVFYRYDIYKAYVKVEKGDDLFDWLYDSLLVVIGAYV